MEQTDGLSKLLASPELMGKITEIARSLQQTSSGETQIPEEPAPSVPAGLDQTLGGILPDGLDLSVFSHALQGLGTSDRRVSLLQAVKCYANGKNRDLPDRAIRAIQLAKVAKLAIGAFSGSQKGEEGEYHV